MRQIVDAIVIEIDLEIVVPEVADAFHGPLVAGDIRGAGFDRMQIAGENILRETVPAGVRPETQADIILGDAVAGNFVVVALIEGKTDRVRGDLVLFQLAAVGRLKDQAVGAMAAVIDETIPAHDQFLREHDGGAGRIFGEGVVEENVVVRIHVVQAVADVVNEVVFDEGIVRERKINAVARLADFVSANGGPVAIPLVDAVAAAIRDQRRVAILRALPDAFFHRLGRWCDRCFSPRSDC